MAEIQILEAQVANQIAAGEVVERPASVIKELVENAIDAGASLIQVEADEGGRSLRVIDNGSGIPPESLELAFQRFATSKLHQYADIWQLNTMGFRGEALPSIASVSKIEALSRTAEHEVAMRLVMHGGRVQESGPAGGPVGTRLQIDELFYNTPARLKFMSQENTELGYIQQLMQAFALGFPQIAFKWSKKGKLVLQTTGKNHLMDVVHQVFGKDLAGSLFSVSHQLRGAEVSGLLSYPDYVRRDRQHQYFFVNQRWVKVPALSKLLDDLYADLVPRRAYPVAILKLSLPSESVDINVHPTKREVKFKNFSLIYQLLREALAQSLERYDVQREHFLSIPQPQTQPTPQQPIAQDADSEQPPFARPAVRPLQSPLAEASSPYTSVTPPPPSESPPWAAPSTPPQVLALPGFEPQTQSSRNEREQATLETIIPVGQVCENTYIIGHFGRDLVFIDQHVAEERYLYERMLEKGEIVKQALLVSVIVELDAEEQELVKTHSELFEQAGFELEAYGPEAIAIRSLPYCLRLSQAEETFDNLLKDLKNFGAAQAQTAAFKLVCKTVACHSAIRAGDPLSLEQMREIVANWARTRNPYTCPHGRPILLKMNKDEINRRFLRTWS